MSSLLDSTSLPGLRILARMQPFDAFTAESGRGKNSPSTIVRSTSPRERAATPASLFSPVTINSHPALAHSCLSLFILNVESFGEGGQPWTNQKNHATTLSTKEWKRNRTFDHCLGMREISRVLPVAINCWIQGIERMGRWTTPQI